MVTPRRWGQGGKSVKSIIHAEFDVLHAIEAGHRQLIADTLVLDTPAQALDREHGSGGVAW